MHIPKTLQTRFTFRSRMHRFPFDIPPIKSRLTKSLPALFPCIADEVVEACNQYIPAKDGQYFSGTSWCLATDNFSSEWFSVNALGVMTKIIARSSNRIFVGPTLCKSNISVCSDWKTDPACILGRNPAWIELAIGHTMAVVETARYLRLSPSFLRPWVSILCFWASFPPEYGFLP